MKRVYLLLALLLVLAGAVSLVLFGLPVAEHKEWCSILRGQPKVKAPVEPPPSQA